MISGSRSLSRYVLPVVLALGVLAGCGSSAGSDPAPVKTTTPTAYTVAQMTAALPKVQDVPNGTSVALRCPQDKDRCGSAPDEIDALVLIGVESGSPVAAEKAANLAIDLVAVEVDVDETAAAAAKSLARNRKGDDAYDGAYDIADQKYASGTVPGEKGRGAVRDFAIDAFEGYRLDRTIDGLLPEGVQATEIRLRQGTATVNVQAKLSSGGRSDEAAGELAESVMRDYLQRLG
jgi:hypothetical protein